MLLSKCCNKVSRHRATSDYVNDTFSLLLGEERRNAGSDRAAQGARHREGRGPQQQERKIYQITSKISLSINIHKITNRIRYLLKSYHSHNKNHIVIQKVSLTKKATIYSKKVFFPSSPYFTPNQPPTTTTYQHPHKNALPHTHPL